eukprot:3106193-Heterocapsa_arctica.AAC.1
MRPAAAPNPRPRAPGSEEESRADGGGAGGQADQIPDTRTCFGFSYLDAHPPRIPDLQTFPTPHRGWACGGLLVGAGFRVVQAAGVLA